MIAELLAQVRDAGLSLSLSNDRVRVGGVGERPAALLEQLRAERDELVEVLAGRRCVMCPSDEIWIRSHDEDWPLCRSCARALGLEQLRDEQPDLFDVVGNFRGSAE